MGVWGRGRWARGRRLRQAAAHGTKLTAQAVVLVVLASGTGAAPAFAAQASAAAAHKLPQAASVPVEPVPVHKIKIPDATRSAVSTPVAKTWPAAGTATATLRTATAASSTSAGARTPVRAGMLPVWVAPVVPAAAKSAKAVSKSAAPAKAAAPAAGTVSVRILDHSAALKTGVDGVLFTAANTTGGGGRADVAVDYAAFKDAYGGDWSSRLHLVQLPACALTTPTAAACRKQTPLASTNSASTAKVSAQITLAPAPAASPTPAVPVAGTAAGSTARSAVQGLAAPQTVVALTSGVSGGAGDYTATPLQPSGTWAAGGSDGDFTYTYPVSVPPAAGGLVPSVALSYDSRTVDGRLASTSSQASLIGDGWDYSPGSVTRSYIPCSDDPAGTAPKVDDSCWDGQILHVSSGALSGDIVQDASTSTGWKLSDSNGEKVELLTGGTNGTYDGDYWKITTTDGTQYFFGLNHLPGWTTGKATTNSAWTEPVYGAHTVDSTHPTADPCYNATFANASCSQAWQWNLDYVKDVHGNAMGYYYGTETNFYGADGTTTGKSYVRAGYLDHIDYGFTDGNAYSANAPQRIQFTVGDRCVVATCTPINSTTYPDVPYDLNCTGTNCTSHSPTFWTMKRLTRITTEVYQGGWTAVDTYALTQTTPSPGDGTSATLWLSQIQHTGTGGAQTPAVLFAGQTMANRYNIGDGYPDLMRYRLTGVTTESGDQIAVTYSDPSCTPAVAPSANTSRCFPVYWGPPGQGTPILDWFNKFVVTSVTDNDATGGSGQAVTTYKYTGTPAWHYDDNEVVKPKNRTWGQWRGYSRVETLTGSTVDGQTRTDTLYYQGMDGDTLPGGALRTATVGLDPAVTVPGAAASVADTDQLAGKARESITYNGAAGSAVAASVDDYWVSAPTATRSRTGLPDLTATMTRPAATYTTQAVTSGPSTTWRSTRTDQGYSKATGLLAFTDDHGDISQSAQETCTSLSYAPANTTVNLSGLVSETETDQGACATGNAATSDGLGYPTGVSRPGNVISDSRTYYDTAAPTSWPPTVPAFPQTAPTAGMPTLTEQAKDYTAGAFTYQITGDHAYAGSYGRISDAWDALGNKAHTDYTTTAGLTTQVKVTNAKGQATTTTLDPTRGLSTSVTDPNNAVTSTTYDGLGRATAVWLPGRAKATQSANFTYSYAVSQSAPSAVTTNTLTDGSGGTYTTGVDLYDALLRKRQTQTQSPAGGRVLTDIYYNSRGQAYTVNNAYWDKVNAPGAALASAADYDVPNQDVTTFDAQGRPVLTVGKDLGTPVPGEQTKTVYGGDRTTVIPPTGGTTVTTVTDARGRTTEVDDYLTAPTVTGDHLSGGTFASTTFTFDAPGSHGQSTKLTDNANNARTSVYNLLGQLTDQTDPDTGHTRSDYDADGELTGTTDALGHSLTYTYDVLGRKLAEYDGTTAAAPELASWSYDDPTVTNSIGQQTASTRYVGTADATTSVPAGSYTEATTGFTALGQPTGDKVTLPAALTAFGATSFTTGQTYTANTSLSKATSYPAAGTLPAETVTTAYDATNDLPTTVAGLASYASATTYDGYSRVIKEALGGKSGSGSRDYGYDDHTGNLTEADYLRGTSPADVDDTTYSYDPSGNLTRTSDAQNNNTSTDTQCYSYDGLDRLTAAWTATDQCATAPVTPGTNPQVGGPNAYWTSWTFDAVGNRLTQDQHTLTGATGDTTTSYLYGQSADHTQQPDTLTSTTTTLPDGTTTGAAYTYDTTGNNTTATDTTNPTTPGTNTQTWNHEGKLASLQSSSQPNPTTYLYDADGNQLLRTSPDGTLTLFLPGQEVTTNPTVSTSVSGQRTITLPGGTTISRYAAGTGFVFLLNNYQGTSTLSLDATAQTPTFRALDPYGNPRGTAPATWHSDQGLVGGTEDAATGLTNLGAREYDPHLGRFISPDPVLEATDPTQIGGYTYAGDNPVTHSDPTGLATGCEDTCAPGETKTVGTGTTVQTHKDTSCNPTIPGCPGHVLHIGPITVPDTIQHYIQIIQIYNRLMHKDFPDGGMLVNELDEIAQICLNNKLCGAPLTKAMDIYWNHRGLMYAATLGGDAKPGDISAAGGGGEGLLGFNDQDPKNGNSEIFSEFADEISDSAGGGCKAHSFLGATQVLLADGTTEAIKEIHAGDQVLATDPLTGTTKDEPVLRLITTTTDHDFTTLTIATTTPAAKHPGNHAQKPPATSTLTTTWHHPFWDATRHRWTDANHLTAGTRLLEDGGTAATVLAVHNFHQSAVTYDLTVQQLHTYYVMAGDTPVLVHNSPVPASGLVPDLSGLTLAQANDLLTYEGFSSTTSDSGAYVTYRGPDGSRVDVQTSNGRVVRSSRDWKDVNDKNLGKRPFRWNPDGTPTASHDTGERVSCP